MTSHHLIRAFLMREKNINSLTAIGKAILVFFPSERNKMNVINLTSYF